MNEVVRHAALRTTARLVLSFGIVGCAAAPDGAVEGSKDDAVRGASALKAGCAVDAAVDADTSPTPHSSWDGTEDDARGPVDVRTACCKHDEKACDDLEAHGKAHPGRFECCDLLGDMGSIACTPWGPPVPPAMLDEVA